MLMLYAALSPMLVGFNPVRFALGFLVCIVMLAILIIGLRYVARVAGITLSPELVQILGLIVFLILLFVLLGWSGFYSF